MVHSNRWLWGAAMVFMTGPLWAEDKAVKSVAETSEVAPPEDVGDTDQTPGAPEETTADTESEGDTGSENEAPGPSTQGDGAETPEPVPGESDPVEAEKAPPPPAPVVVAAKADVPTPPETTPEPRSGPRRMLGLLGPGVGIGIFYPKAVNDYINNWTDRQGATLESGFTAMVMNVVPKVAFNFAPIEFVQIQILGEIGWGPKVLAVAGGDSHFFNYMRYSVGGTVNGHIPIKGKYSVLLGAGALFHWLRFEDYGAATPGARGLLGFRMYLKKVIPEIFVAFDWIRDDSDEKQPRTDLAVNADGSSSLVTRFERLQLDYTGVTIGVNIYFQLFGQ